MPTAATSNFTQQVQTHAQQQPTNTQEHRRCFTNLACYSIATGLVLLAGTFALHQLKPHISNNKFNADQIDMTLKILFSAGSTLFISPILITCLKACFKPRNQNDLTRTELSDRDHAFFENPRQASGDHKIPILQTLVDSKPAHIQIGVLENPEPTPNTETQKNPEQSETARKTFIVINPA